MTKKYEKNWTNLTRINTCQYLRRMNLPDARVWFRFRCEITSHINGNMSSMYRDNMKCRYYKSVVDETQEHLEECYLLLLPVTYAYKINKTESEILSMEEK